MTDAPAAAAARAVASPMPLVPPRTTTRVLARLVMSAVAFRARLILPLHRAARAGSASKTLDGGCDTLRA